MMTGTSKFIRRLPIRPAETIFSWVTRYHFRFGNYRIKETIQHLFGLSRIRIHPFLPSYLEQIASDELLVELIQQHTLYPLFHYFGADNGDKYLKRLNTDNNTSISNLIAHAGLACSSGHYFCIRCVEEEMKQTGLRIYRIKDQLPGLDCCPIHGIKLMYTDNSDFGIDRGLQLPTYIKSSIKKAPPKNVEVAITAHELIEETTNIEVSAMGDVIAEYYLALDELGLLTLNGQIRHSHLKESIRSFYKGYQPPQGLEYFLDFDFLGPMLRKKSRANQHPIHHVLFRTWLDFMRANCDGRLFIDPPDSPIKPDIDDLVLSKIKLGWTIAEIKSEFSCSHSVVERVAALNGCKIGPLCEPTPSWYQHFLIMALLGRHRKSIARKLNIRLHKVETEISRVPGLALWRHDLEKMRKLEHSTLTIKVAVINNPDWSRQLIKQAFNKEFFYLYKYDPERLEELLPPKQENLQNSKNWTKVDFRLYEAILKIEGIERMSTSRIGHIVRDNGLLRRSIDKLPHTNQLLLKLGVLKEGD